VKRLLFMLMIGVIGSISGSGFVFSQSAGKTMYVAVKSTEIKSATGVFASKLGDLNLGAAVTVLKEDGKWAQIRSGSITGWVNLSSLSSKRVTSSGGSSSAQEIALAGKGFAETEIEYRNSGLDFSVVDQMEKITIPIGDLQKFIKDGRLKEGK